LSVSCTLAGNISGGGRTGSARIALLGATGTVGQRFCELLSGHPYFGEPDLYASGRSAGKTLREFVNLPDAHISPSLLSSSISEVDAQDIVSHNYIAVFSALPSSSAQEIEVRLEKAGLRIFTNASPNRMRPDVPLVVPEVNHEHLRMVWEKRGFIVANGNCSSIGLALALRPLVSLGIEHVEVTTMQALSGAGYPGVPSLDALGNVIPFIDSEEEKLSAEIPKMLGAYSDGKFTPFPVRVDATCTRVPVRDGHMEAVRVQCSSRTDAEEVRRLLASFRSLPQELALPTAPVQPVIVREERDRPQPLLDVNAGSPERARGMAASVGRIRVEGNSIRFVVLTHNTIRGAAGGSVLNAELMYAGGGLH